MIYYNLIKKIEERLSPKQAFSGVAIYRRNEILADEPARIGKDVLYIYPGSPEPSTVQHTAGEEFGFPVMLLYKFARGNRALVNKADDEVVRKKSEVVDAVLDGMYCWDSQQIMERVVKMQFDQVVMDYLPDYPVADLEQTTEESVFRILFQYTFTVTAQGD
jgi:hypothetical protein